MSFAIVTRPSSNSATNGLNEVAALTIDGTKCLEGHRDEGVSCRQLTIFGCLHFSGLLRRGTRRLGRNGQITGSQSVSYYYYYYYYYYLNALGWHAARAIIIF